MHAAGVVDLGPLGELTTEAWQSQLAVNLVAPAVLSRVCLPAVRAARGTFVFVNSGAGLVAHPGWSAYAASKFGLRALADSLRAEEQGRHVRGASVSPRSTRAARRRPMQQKVHRQEGKEYDAVRLDRPGHRGRRHPARARPARRRDGQRPDDPALVDEAQRFSTRGVNSVVGPSVVGLSVKNVASGRRSTLCSRTRTHGGSPTMARGNRSVTTSVA